MSNINEFVQYLKYDSNGLIPCIVQDINNGDVLMMAYMNAESVRKTLETGRTCFWSRSRQTFWIKGETSGNVQRVREFYIDCDRDCIVCKVEQTGAACHEGYRSCFFRRVDSSGNMTVVLEQLQDKY
ncbi:MAG: phosphoribosyl-AMP cyclohydrolase [Abditibacteriota bacterium]|nr:phosphoribosyl-AMP cyclohydrolase [Abditibacteriota bacterium]MBR4748689.1 phosphoribosyl-AMP cyclohydrolase [Abditibacteriota bacterium]